ncbi:AAA family ATPase [Fictibacillus sp. 26RED30]|uniref:AAA family ATPase n=1 Tax=Fictibacillus sp. 26RED30 TaxID=2745877 RepID=UPI0018CDAA1D|nr:AAA family ATPase [Fictibacillus sp. 26RED30]MBH0160461.1 hypothetical protein [Fictibacillus sp. 26RED30]
MANFYIMKVTITNFRGYKDQKFEFFNNNSNKQGLILLGGPNGYGKTSFLDSIEWCLTGTIKRLEKEYKLRHEGTLKMQKGILKYNGTTEDTVVSIEAEFNNQNVVMTRRFNDRFESNGLSLGKPPFEVTINEVKVDGAETIDDVLGINIAKTFYERHISSYEKNIRVYEKGRNDFVELFAQFFGGTEELDTLIKNLEGYQEKSKQKKVVVPGIINEFDTEIKEKSNLQQTKLDELKIEEDKLSVLLENQKTITGLDTRLIDYPEKKLYSNEQTASYLYSISNMDERNEQINQQITNLEKLKVVTETKSIYLSVKEFIVYLSNQIRLDMFRENVLTPYILNEEEINKIKNIKTQILEYEFSDINAKLVNFQKLKNPNIQNLKSLTETLKSFAEYEAKYSKEIDIFFSLYERGKILNEKLEFYQTQNKAIQALRTIIDHIDGFQELKKKNHKNCPLCGSDDFSNENLEVGIIARETIGQHENDRAIIQKELFNIQQDFQNGYNSLIQELIKNHETKKDEIQQLMNSYNSYKTFFIILNQYKLDHEKINLQILLNFEVKLAEKLVTNSTAESLERSILNGLLNQHNLLEGIPSKIVKSSDMSIEEYKVMDFTEKRKIFTAYKDFWENQLHDIDFINKDIFLEDNIQIDTIVLRMGILKDILRVISQNDKIKQLSENVNKLKERVQSENIGLRSLEAQHIFFKKTLRDLKILQTKYNNEIVQQINGPLKKIFKRLNRHTNIDSINLISEGLVNHKVSLSATFDEESEIFVANALSAGQLSIVSISIFLTIAMGQKNLPFRCYFMDDPIQTMDDLNILSFVDLLRSELKSEDNGIGFFDQIFITTCDENLEKLIQHKMKTFGVNITHLHFSNYGEYQVQT